LHKYADTQAHKRQDGTVTKQAEADRSVHDKKINATATPKSFKNRKETV